MLPSTLLQSLLGSLLDEPAVVEIASQTDAKALSLIQEHFTYTADEISKVYQDSYGYALGAIFVGLQDEIIALTDQISQSKITNEFAAQIEKHYFQPFAEKCDVPSKALSPLRKQLVENIRDLLKCAEQFQFDEITEKDFAALIHYQGTIAITDLVMEQIASLDNTVADFLRYDELLGNAVLFFFREQIHTDKRFKMTQAELQRDGLCITVQDIQSELQTVKKNIHQALEDDLPIAEFALQRDQLKQVQATWQTRHEQLIHFNQCFENQLGEILDWAKNVNTQFYEIQDDVKEARAEANENNDLAEVIQELEKVAELMVHQNLSPQIKARDEFIQHNSTSFELIWRSVNLLKQLPTQNSQYGRMSIMVGSALFSTGEIAQTEQLFLQAIEVATNQDEKALAHFNLFQVQLEKKIGDRPPLLSKQFLLTKGSFICHSEKYTFCIKSGLSPIFTPRFSSRFFWCMTRSDTPYASL